MAKRLICIVQDEETQMELSNMKIVIPDDEFYKIIELFKNGDKFGIEFANDIVKKYGISIRKIDREQKTIDIIDISNPLPLPPVPEYLNPFK